MSKVYFGGVPTSIDVRKIKEALTEIREGDEITHETMEEILGIGRHENRYRTVTSAWRRSMLNDHGVQIGALGGVGFRCMNAVERISDGVKGFKSGARKQMRSVRKVSMVRTDDPQLMKTQDVLRRLGAAIASEMNKEMKEVALPTVAKQLPRLVPKDESTDRSDLKFRRQS